MRKIKLIFYLLCCTFAACAQPSYTTIQGAQRFQGTLGLPVKDTTLKGIKDTAIVVINPNDGKMYYRYKGFYQGSVTQQDITNINQEINILMNRPVTAQSNMQYFTNYNVAFNATGLNALDLAVYTPGRIIMNVTTQGTNGSGFLNNFGTTGDTTYIHYTIAPGGIINFSFSGIITDSTKIIGYNIKSLPYSNEKSSLDFALLTGIDKYFKI